VTTRASRFPAPTTTNNRCPAISDRFDLIVSSFAIHHCAPERQRALYGELLARLAPGGRYREPRARRVADARAARCVPRGLGITPEEEDPANQLVGLETQLGWLRDLGYAEVELLLEVAASSRSSPEYGRTEPSVVHLLALRGSG